MVHRASKQVATKHNSAYNDFLRGEIKMINLFIAELTLTGCLDLFALNVSTSFATEFSTLCKISPHFAHKSLELFERYYNHVNSIDSKKICYLIKKFIIA